MITISAKEARQNFSYVLNQVEIGEEVIIARRGHIIAHIVPHREKSVLKKLPKLQEFRKFIKVKGLPLSAEICKMREEE